MESSFAAPTFCDLQAVKASCALKLTVQQRLGFEITLARARVERAYKRMQDDLHALHRYPDSTMIALHEAEQILTALERVSGSFYRHSLEDAKACRKQQKQRAEQEARNAFAKAKS